MGSVDPCGGGGSSFVIKVTLSSESVGGGGQMGAGYSWV